MCDDGAMPCIRECHCMALQAEVQTVTGAVHMLFLETVIGNAYQNLSNIVLTIRPTDLSTQQGVLIASHYDSLIGSPGAAWQFPAHSARARDRQSQCTTRW
jgi:hypothetical protein